MVALKINSLPTMTAMKINIKAVTIRRKNGPVTAPKPCTQKIFFV
jgi:hypothetical protein